MSKPGLDVVWFKRDLRLSDHAPLAEATRSGRPTLLLYIVEPSLVDDPHYSLRHWRFIWESLEAMRDRLNGEGLNLCVQYGEAQAVLEALHREYGIGRLLSHEEIGIDRTFQRDRAVARWAHNQGIEWREWPTGAVQRGLTHRRGWDAHWQRVMRADIEPVELGSLAPAPNPPESWQAPASWRESDTAFQSGGEPQAWQTLESFYAGRGKNYYRELSSPLTSAEACSRLSPYLAWGNLSLRQAYQTLLSHWQTPGWRRSLRALSSRFHWHCHFMQKFESECEMEFRPVNRAYRDFPYRDDDAVAADLAAWERGETGVPMVDACMKCLWHTGYINFRMRSMLVSFLCHHLNIDWRLGVHHLARLFLDFEPGIHYPQFQMQAGVTGTNTIRLYNPLKQGRDQDPEARFISHWLPALDKLPVESRFEPGRLGPMDEAFYDFYLGRDYPAPIVEVVEAARIARARLWGFRARSDVKAEARRILERHTRPGR